MNEPPSPSGVASYDELADRLRSLRVWAGVSYRELHRRVVRFRQHSGLPELPAYDTVYRCLRPGRSRLDTDLVIDIVRVLLGDEPGIAEWRQACQTAAGGADEASIVTVSATLPADIAEFTGREVELKRLLGAIDNPVGGTVVISAIQGMAGVGKTKLAIHAAHRLVERGRFPDVRLSVNLRGYDADRPPADPSAVLDGFLRTLGVPGSQIAGLDLAGRTARFRELLAGKRALLVLDNAASEDQVRPLLPDSPTCLVLVTSRRELPGLGATGLRLGAFSPPEAVGMLRNALSDTRIDADPNAAARIVDLVGHLPLAVALVAARIQATPDWSLTDHIERLLERRSLLRLDDAVEVALGMSYDELSAGPRHLLRLLALHPGRDMDAYAAAALADTSLRTARHTLDELLAANVLQRRSDQRYELHDLVRVFAADRVRDEETPRARRQALTRLLDYYRYASVLAMREYAPTETARRRAVPEPATPCPTFGDIGAATAWLDAERPNLIAVALHAVDHDWPDHTSDLSALLFPYLNFAGHHRDAEILHTRASHTASAAAKGHALTYLGFTYLVIGRYEEAVEQLQNALTAYRDAGDPGGEGGALTALGGVRGQLGQYAEAARCFERAVWLARKVGDRAHEARHLTNLGNVYERLGRYTEALQLYQEALPIARETNDRRNEGHTLALLGEVYGRLGEYAKAIEHIEQGMAIAKETGNRISLADTLNFLGFVRIQLGEHQRGLELHLEALSIVREDGLREIEVQTLNDIGAALRALGEPDRALERHQHALALARDLGDRVQQAQAHDGLGHAYEMAGDHDNAQAHRDQAFVIRTELGTPEAGSEFQARQQDAAGAGHERQR